MAQLLNSPMNFLDFGNLFKNLRAYNQQCGHRFTQQQTSVQKCEENLSKALWKASDKSAKTPKKHAKYGSRDYYEALLYEHANDFCKSCRNEEEEQNILHLLGTCGTILQKKTALWCLLSCYVHHVVEELSRIDIGSLNRLIRSAEWFRD